MPERLTLPKHEELPRWRWGVVAVIVLGVAGLLVAVIAQFLLTFSSSTGVFF